MRIAILVLVLASFVGCGGGDIDDADMAAEVRAACLQKQGHAGWPAQVATCAGKKPSQQ